MILNRLSRLNKISCLGVWLLFSGLGMMLVAQGKGFSFWEAFGDFVIDPMIKAFFVFPWAYVAFVFALEIGRAAKKWLRLVFVRRFDDDMES